MKYLIAVEWLHILNYAINTNNFELQLRMWEETIQGCYGLYKVNFARFGTYVIQLKKLEQKHPGGQK